MPPKRSAEEALAIVRALKQRYLTPEIAQGAAQGRERLRRLRADETPAETPPPPPPSEPEFTPVEREKARAVLAAIRRRLAGEPLPPAPSGLRQPWRPKG